MNLRSKLPNVGDTIFSEMTLLSKEYQAINLGQGYPDYQPDSALLQAITDAMLEGHNQYAPMAGVPALREAIATKVRGQHGHSYDPNTEVTVTSGASEALMTTFQALVHQGDEVILIDPSYDLYAPAIVLAGGNPVRVPMRPPTPEKQEFTVDWNAVEAAFSTKTRMLVLNFPHNPTGIIMHEEDLDALDHLAARYPQFLMVSDEAYEHIVFDGEEQRSVVRRPALAARSVLISSFGKTFHATGWKIGYCCAPEPITREIRRIHQFVVYSVNTPMQVGIAQYLQKGQAIASLAAFYQKKRDRLATGLSNTPLRPLRSSGTFFLLVDTTQLAANTEKELAIRLTKEVGVTSIPVSAFYPEPAAPAANHRLLRLCFAKQDPTLDQAVERLQGVR
ncbi:Methionine aminotransferase OS=Castellaniella defragrans OX=75697 GN=HNR28_003579 PE=4 SV=1 [Castellaniella defragrans]